MSMLRTSPSPLIGSSMAQLADDMHAQLSSSLRRFSLIIKSSLSRQISCIFRYGYFRVGKTVHGRIKMYVCRCVLSLWDQLIFLYLACRFFYTHANVSTVFSTFTKGMFSYLIVRHCLGPKIAELVSRRRKKGYVKRQFSDESLFIYPDCMTCQLAVVGCKLAPLVRSASGGNENHCWVSVEISKWH